MAPNLPYLGIRIVELNADLLSGRLSGLLFADQGAEVVILNCGEKNGSKLTDGDEKSEKAVNDFLNRNKIRPASYTKEEEEKLLKGADVIIVDGERNIDRAPHQIVLHVVAALPGDKLFGHLPHDCDEGLLLALTGFFTDMALSWFLDRPVIYTPLKICSIYAGVIGADATAAALIDRTRNGGKGREIHASRLAAGLSAIGALSLNISGPGLPNHLESVKISHFRRGISKEEMEEHIKVATNDSSKQLWLEQRLFPFGSPYHSKDGTFILPMATFNKRIARRICDHLGIWDELQSKSGVVDADPYNKENDQHRFNNLALPMNFSWQVSSAIAEMLSQVFKKKTAIEWEKEISAAGIPCVRIESYQDWMALEDTRKAKLSVRVDGCDTDQVGRAAWLSSVGSEGYPAMQKMREVESVSQIIDLNKKFEFSGQDNEKSISKKPLKGFVAVDFSNVLAGPNCGRMLSELGATVYKVEPNNPQHPPMVMVAWQAEGNAGKKTIILDMHTEKGKEVMYDLVKMSDIVVINKSDNQVKNMGLDRETLNKLNPKIIQLNLQARKGEDRTSESANWPGYDPALQGKTGLSYRFGPPGCPTLHGVASCVDYCTAYLGAWSGLTALYAREANGISGECAGASLALTASLMQCTHLGDGKETAIPEGPKATGPNAYKRVYQLQDGKWIYVVADCDLTKEIQEFESVEEGIKKLAEKGYLAVEVHSTRMIADRNLEGESKTVCYENRERCGLRSSTWKPTWICYDNEPLEHPGAVGPTGCDKEEILSNVLKYNESKAKELINSGVVGQDYWVDCKN